VEGDVPVDNESLLLTDFVNLKINPVQSFGGAHRGSLCVCVFIWVSAHTCMSIYICTVFLKKYYGIKILCLQTGPYFLHIANKLGINQLFRGSSKINYW
jgi:hypothetical protein